MIALFQAEAPASPQARHCEEPTGDVAISCGNVRIGTQQQEIATPSARNDSGNFSLIPLVLPGGNPGFSAWVPKGISFGHGAARPTNAI